MVEIITRKNRKLGSQILHLEHHDIHKFNLEAFVDSRSFALDIHPSE